MGDVTPRITPIDHPDKTGKEQETDLIKPYFFGAGVTRTQ